MQFFLDGTSLASVSSEPFLFDATAPTATGSHTVQAVATDLLGRTSTSMVIITVTAAVAAAPPVSDVVTPADGRSLIAGSTLALSVSAADPATALDHVSLYANGTLVKHLRARRQQRADGSRRSRPTHPRGAAAAASNVFQTNFTLPGTDQIVNMVAVALDKLGQSTVSKVASIHSVVTSDRPPLITLGGVNNGAHVTVGSTSAVAVTASASATNVFDPGKTRQDATGTLALSIASDPPLPWNPSRITRQARPPALQPEGLLKWAPL